MSNDLQMAPTTPSSTRYPLMPPPTGVSPRLTPTALSRPCDGLREPSRAEDPLEPPPSQAGSPLAKAIGLGRRVHSTLASEGQLDLHARGRKTYSCRKLARKYEVPASTLWRALAIYQLAQRHPELVRCRHVGVGHLSVLLGLPREHQLHFLRRTEQSRWSRAQLERQIKRLAVRPPDSADAEHAAS